MSAADPERQPAAAPQDIQDVERPQPIDLERLSQIDERKLELVLQAVSLSHSGPLPLPAMLAEYEQVVPGLAADIAGQFKSEAEHRRDMERQDRDILRRGQLFGFVSVLAALGVAAAALVLGHPTAAGVIGGSTVVGVAGVFVIGRLTRPGSSVEAPPAEETRQ